MVNQRGLIQPVLLLLVIIFLVLVTSTGIYYFKKNSKSDSSNKVVLTSSPSVPSPSQYMELKNEISYGTGSGEFANWKTYSSEHCHIAFEYPGNWQILSSFDDTEFGCGASFGIPGDSSEILMFSTPRGMSWEEMISQYPNSKKVTISGSEGILSSNPKSFMHAVNFIKGLIIFQLALINIDQYRESDSAFEHIMQSVRFSGSDADYNKAFKTLFPIENK